MKFGVEGQFDFKIEGLEFGGLVLDGLIGGSWVGISGDIGRITRVITHIRGLATPPVSSLTDA